MAPIEEIVLKQAVPSEQKKTRRVKEKETDPRRLSQRQKQIDFGMPSSVAFKRLDCVVPRIDAAFYTG